MPKVNNAALENDLLLRGVWEGLGTPECHITGGYVRDRLLGRKCVDLDLVLPGDIETSAGPARRLAARLDTRAHVLGRDGNRVWRIECPEIKIEIWPLGDLSPDEDIKRRDFSCNALFWRLPNGPLDDRIGGQEDLENGVVRALSKQNLEDDPVRLVRGPRFLAQLEGFELDPKTANWIRSLAPEVSEAPRERIGQELLKLLAAPGAADGLRSLLELGLLEPAAPDAAQCDRDWIECNISAAARLSGSAPHPVAASVEESGNAPHLALIFRAWGCPDADTVTSFAWSRSERRHAARAAALLDHALTTAEAPATERRAFIHTTGTAFPTALAFGAAVQPNHPWARWWRMWRERGPELVRPSALLSGEEVGVVLDLQPGPDLGRAINGLTDAQVRGKVRTANGARRWLRGYSKRNVQTLEP
ncbi:MAG: CCA tRNA nucleotidyltransferase [Acidobacteria bacterium]|nr:CCA tRNA nucleotidyltransferase [Candidatus Sulfomarinibacter kjeldsenii]